jgi:hypothetical protein
VTKSPAAFNDRWPDELRRRAFLSGLVRAALGGATALSAIGLAGCGASSNPSRRLPARASRTVLDRVQRLHSRPDLQPPQVLMDVPGDPSGGLIFTDCHAGPGQQGPLVVDPRGRVVWFEPLSANASPALRAFNVRVQSYRGRPVLTWWRGSVSQAHGQGYYEIRDTSYRRVAEVRAGNGYQGDLHEFLLTDSGTALFTCYGRATAALPTGQGDTSEGVYFYGVVQEVDVASGRLLFEWRSDRHVDPADSYHARPADPSVPWDYFHVNSIAIDPDDGHLLISGRNTWAVYKVHRRTGAVLSTLGGRRNDFSMGPGTHFAFQHHVVAHPDGTVSIFDNEGGPPSEASQSRALVLAVDQKARSVRLAAQYRHRPPILSEALGSVQRLGDGGRDGTFVGWGDSSYFTRYDGSGALALDGRLALGTLSYRAFQQAWTGRPGTAPALAVTRSGTSASLYASWNGATEHRLWRVLGGAGPRQLKPLGDAQVADFETVITISGAPAWVAIEALDEAGASLGRSAPVRV